MPGAAKVVTTRSLSSTRCPQTPDGAQCRSCFGPRSRDAPIAAMLRESTAGKPLF